MKTIETLPWAKGPEGEEIHLYKMTNAVGASVVLSEIGAGIVEINVPDKDGKMANVALGYSRAEDYFNDGPCMGKIPGRYANRIAGAKFILDGKEYRLLSDKAAFQLHGGPGGYADRIWKGRVSEDGVEFLLEDPDGKNGYPGNVEVLARYEWDDDCSLVLSLRAHSDKPTVINLTNHAYFNLKGEGNGDILGHELALNASDYVVTDSDLVPTGEIATVAGTPMDFSELKAIGRDISVDFPALKAGKGYDSCWIIDGQPGQLNLAARLEERLSGRVLEVLTTQPGIQVYTGNWLNGCPKGRGGSEYHDYYGVALECQHLPDSPNHPDFPTAVLRPGEEFNELIIFRFYTR